MRPGIAVSILVLAVACKQQSPNAVQTATATAAGSIADPVTTEVGSPRFAVTLAPLAKQVTPAVVAIQSVFRPDSNAQFGEFGQSGEPQPTEGLGSGFIVSP